MFGRNFTKAAGLSIACFLHSPYGAEFFELKGAEDTGFAHWSKVTVAKRPAPLVHISVVCSGASTSSGDEACIPPPALACSVEADVPVALDSPELWPMIPPPLSPLPFGLPPRAGSEVEQALDVEELCAAHTVEEMAVTPVVKNTFLEFMPTRRTVHKRKTAPEALIAGLASLFDN